MINITSLLNSEKYKVVDIKEGIELYYIENEMLYQDKYFKLVGINNKKVIYEVSRGSQQQIGTFQDESLAYALLIVLCYKYFERIVEDNQIKRELRKFAEQNDIQAASQVINKECGEQLFSIFEYKDNAVCLIKNQELYNVYYKNNEELIEIVTDVKLSRGFVITYNYAKKINLFKNLFNKIVITFSLDKNYYYTLLKYYI